MGLTSGAWSFEPLQIDMRSGNIIKGLRLALLGCRQGDEVEAYMTYNMAYGDTNFSTIARESPLAWFFTVDAVE
jgi:FKBP-type peptidyl-prolyl cis-trans isomerase